MLTKKDKSGLTFSSFRIQGHRMDLRDGGCFRGRKCNFGIYGPIWSVYISKCSQKNIKRGYLPHIFGFEAIQHGDATIEAAHVTFGELVSMTRSLCV